jgi:hypothetical protein
VGLKALAGSIAAITGGTGIPILIGQSSIPMVVASSGSIGNNGALTGHTALPLIYPHCYLYLPADAIVAGSAAGWYYAVMSSTTAGTIYNNTYTSGVPTVPASPTAFATTGPGAYTGVLTEHGVILPIPANTLALPGSALEIDVKFAQNNTGGTKTVRMRYSGATGTDFLSVNTANNASASFTGFIGNAGGSANQRGYVRGLLGATALGSNGTLATVDTTAATDLRLTHNHSGAATDHGVIESFSVKMVRPVQ